MNNFGIFWVRCADELRLSYLKRNVSKIKKQISSVKYYASGRASAAYWKNRDKRLATGRLWKAKNKDRIRIQYEIRKLKHKLQKMKENNENA